MNDNTTPTPAKYPTPELAQLIRRIQTKISGACDADYRVHHSLAVNTLAGQFDPTELNDLYALVNGWE